MNVEGKKIFVGLSGGVDSSVTAALLTRAGARVHGVFIKGWYPPRIACTWKADRNDAMRVAAHLGIPFTTLDAAVEYKKHVIDYLISEYKMGRTPNPDIFCNKYVKFGAFYDFAIAEGADYVATGHYARVVDGSLHRGTDVSKDQSYFLWNVEPKHLKHILFPLGSYAKEEVRTLAREFALPTALKRDSQGICFLGSISIDEFLASSFGLEEGEIRTTTGEHIGTHKGAAAYTLGERLNVPGASHPWYVVSKDMNSNTLVAGSSPESSSGRSDILLEDTNFFEKIDSGTKLTAQYRYHGPCIEGTYNNETQKFTPEQNPSEHLTPGQSLVFYRGDQLVGGGIIG